MRTIIITLVVLALVGVLVVDGLRMYAGHRVTVEVAERAAQEAARAYVASHGNDAVAQGLVRQIAEQAGVVVVAAGPHSGTTDWYQVTVRQMPDTHVLGLIPYLRDLLAQESTALVHF